MGTKDSTHRPLDWIDEQLEALAQQGLRRELAARHGPQTARLMIDGRALINFGSNDYLGLAADPRLSAAVVEAIERDGFGSGASPLVTGFAEEHDRLQRRLAQFEGTEAALLFPSGFAANVGTIAAMVGPGDVVFADRKNHASLWDGCRLCRADVRVYPHNDWQQLDKLLAKADHYGRRLIATDSLFSMDGDLAPLDRLVEVARRRDAMLLVDEAHATGVFGKQGRGVAEHLGVEGQIDIRIGTLSKALGSIGGFVAGSESLVQWLINKARPYIFSTALPPIVAAAATVALDIACEEPRRRERLLQRAGQLRETLADQGWNTGASASQIIPLILGDPFQVVQLAKQLRQRGLLVPAIRPPTVPEGEACLRISLTTSHTAEMITQLIETLAEVKPV